MSKAHKAVALATAIGKEEKRGCRSCGHYLVDRLACELMDDKTRVVPTDGCELYVRGEPKTGWHKPRNLASPDDIGFHH